MTARSESAENQEGEFQSVFSLNLFAVFVFGLLTALIVFYEPWLSGHCSYYFEDITHFFEPLCRFIGDGIRHMRLPLWNPYSYCGMSQAAISSPGIFYPFNLLFALLPFSQALALNMIISQLACGIGSYLLVRSFRWHFWSAVAAGGMTAMTGYMFSLYSNYTLVASAAWVPLLLFCISGFCRATERAAVLWMGGLALFLAFMLLAGRPEISAPALVLAVVFAIYSLFQMPVERRSSRAVSMVKAFFMGGLLSMPSILPLLEWVPWSRRSEGLLSPETLMFSANWFDLSGIFLSHPLGDLQMRHSLYRTLVLFKNFEPYYGSAFVGAGFFALALLGMQRPGKNLYRLACLGLLFSVLSSLGSNVPGAEFLVERLPFLSILRFPLKFLFFVLLFISLFAARGLNAYLNGKFSPLIPLTTVTVFILLASFSLLSPVNILPFYGAAESNPSFLIAAQRLIAVQSLLSGFFAFLVFLILWFCRKRPAAGAALVVVFSLLLLLSHDFANYRKGADAAFLKKPSFAAEQIKAAARRDGIENPRFMGLYLDKFTLPPQYTAADPLLDTISTYQYSRQALRPGTNMGFRLPSAFGFEGSMVGEYYYLMVNSYLASSQWSGSGSGSAGTAHDNFLSDLPLERLLRLTATDYVLTQTYRHLNDPRLFRLSSSLSSIALSQKRSAVSGLNPQRFDLILESEPYNLRLYKVKNTLPRAYLSHDWRIYKSRDEVVESLVSTASDFDPARLTIIETLDNLPAGGSGELLQPLNPQDETPEHVVIKVACKSPSVLVLCDQYYPGWKAYLDGEPISIMRCNGFMRSVFLAASGEHLVEFKYEPLSVRAGILLCGLAVLWWLLCCYESRRPNKIKDTTT